MASAKDRASSLQQAALRLSRHANAGKITSGLTILYHNELPTFQAVSRRRSEEQPAASEQFAFTFPFLVPLILSYWYPKPPNPMYHMSPDYPHPTTGK